MTDTRLRALSAGIGLALASAVLSGCISTATYGTGEHPEVAMFREVTGGLGAPKREPIQYQPRAPLVMPPSGELPPPVDGAQVASADWPVDPDRTAPPSRLDDDTITPEKRRELQALYEQLPERERTAAKREPHRSTLKALEIQGQQKKTFSAAIADAKGSNCTDRRFLTQPPTEYCQPAETAPQTFEGMDEEKKPGFFGRLFGRS